MLSIVGLGALLLGIIEGPAKGWTDPLVIAGFVVGIVASVSFVLWELHTPNPMLDMRFFKNPRFTAANSAITLTFFAMFGSMFLMTQYWQFVHGYSPLARRRADDPVRPHDDGGRPAVGPPRRAASARSASSRVGLMHRDAAP